jgi:hypothetical protein
MAQETPCDKALQAVRDIGSDMCVRDYAEYLQEVFDEVEMLLDAANNSLEAEEEAEDERDQQEEE